MNHNHDPKQKDCSDRSCSSISSISQLHCSHCINSSLASPGRQVICRGIHAVSPAICLPIGQTLDRQNRASFLERLERLREQGMAYDSPMGFRYL